MQNAFKTIKNGQELLEFLQSCSHEELSLPLARTDNGPEYGPFYDEIDEVSIKQVSMNGFRGRHEWRIVF